MAECSPRSSPRRNSIAEYIDDKNQGFPLSRFQKVSGKQLFSEEDHLVICVQTRQLCYLSGNQRTCCCGSELSPNRTVTFRCRNGVGTNATINTGEFCCWLVKN